MDPPVLDQPLPHVQEAAASAREATRSFLSTAARERLPEHAEAADVVLLVVSELVGNAIRHTDGPCTLHLALARDDIEIRVTDTSPDPPRPRRPDHDGTGGWGWTLVNHLTTSLHVEPAPNGGKTICARIPW